MATSQASPRRSGCSDSKPLDRKGPRPADPESYTRMGGPPSSGPPSPYLPAMQMQGLAGVAIKDAEDGRSWSMRHGVAALSLFPRDRRLQSLLLRRCPLSEERRWLHEASFQGSAFACAASEKPWAGGCAAAPWHKAGTGRRSVPALHLIACSGCAPAACAAARQIWPSKSSRLRSSPSSSPSSSVSCDSQIRPHGRTSMR